MFWENVFCFRFLFFVLRFFFLSIFRILSGRFDTSRSLIALSVSEISALGGFCDEQDKQELGILVVGFECIRHTLSQTKVYILQLQCNAQDHKNDCTGMGLEICEC